jgi:pyruvate/2-oxoglutarate dehydrogenase complex dihydrolipoamide dehydrogenase (E3) component
VVIVGGAATGCQLAAIFNAFGSQVTVLDVAPRILAAEDSHVAQAMTEAFARRGIAVATGIGGIERIERAGKELALVYRSWARGCRPWRPRRWCSPPAGWATWTG